MTLRQNLSEHRTVKQNNTFSINKKAITRILFSVQNNHTNRSNQNNIKNKNKNKLWRGEQADAVVGTTVHLLDGQVALEEERVKVAALVRLVVGPRADACRVDARRLGAKQQPIDCALINAYCKKVNNTFQYELMKKCNTLAPNIQLA